MIVADDLGFAYPDGPELFGGLDVTVGSGQVVALTGASGRGKSTLLYVF
ncbi:MAG: ATP-binding cassette domain-containing protein, partial [Actinomycetota bacterium]